MNMGVQSKKESNGGGQTYTYSSRPRRVHGCYKEELDEPRNINNNNNNNDTSNDPWSCEAEHVTPIHEGMMYDRRIIRGSTYARHIIPMDNPLPIDRIEVQRRRNATKRALLARKQKLQECTNWTPEPVYGREHRRVQTELYLETLQEHVDEAEQECQTDLFLDRPATPRFIPEKIGFDKETQIYDGDLFDFDIEVNPVLEVLVGKTVEQSLLEAMEEEELAALREHQHMFEELRNAEHEEEQRLEEQERRRKEEKHRRMKQEIERVRLEKLLHEKIAARAFAQGYLSELVPAVFHRLSDHGYFYDPIENDLEHRIIPWLMNLVKDCVAQKPLPRKIIDYLIRDVVDMRFLIFHEMDETIYPPRVYLGDDEEEEEEEDEEEEEIDEHMPISASSSKLINKVPSSSAPPPPQGAVSSVPRPPSPK